MTLSNNAQTLFKSLLVVQTLALVIYTAFAVQNEGWTLFQIFGDNIQALSWNGQFNLDFSCYLTLSGLWIFWRNQFSFSSGIMAVLAMIMGIIVFAPYLFYLVINEKGNLTKVLVGARISDTL